MHWERSIHRHCSDHTAETAADSAADTAAAQPEPCQLTPPRQLTPADGAGCGCQRRSSRWLVRPRVSHQPKTPRMTCAGRRKWRHTESGGTDAETTTSSHNHDSFPASASNHTRIVPCDILRWKCRTVNMFRSFEMRVVADRRMPRYAGKSHNGRRESSSAPHSKIISRQVRGACIHLNSPIERKTHNRTAAPAGGE